MIGPKKLNTIRQELRHALAASGDDPIRWLEERMTAPKAQSPIAPPGDEVLHSLRRFLEGPERGKRQTQRVRTKK
jgi:hypothetical protein